MDLRISGTNGVNGVFDSRASANISSLCWLEYIESMHTGSKVFIILCYLGALARTASMALLTLERRSSSCCPTGMSVMTVHVGYLSLRSLALIASMALLTVDRRLIENGMTVCILYVPWDVSGVNGVNGTAESRAPVIVLFSHWHECHDSRLIHIS